MADSKSGLSGEIASLRRIIIDTSKEIARLEAYSKKIANQLALANEYRAKIKADPEAAYEFFVNRKREVDQQIAKLMLESADPGKLSQLLDHSSLLLEAKNTANAARLGVPIDAGAQEGEPNGST